MGGLIQVGMGQIPVLGMMGGWMGERRMGS
jgi:hypothetical protein